MLHEDIKKNHTHTKNNTRWVNAKKKMLLWKQWWNWKIRLQTNSMREWGMIFKFNVKILKKKKTIY